MSRKIKNLLISVLLISCNYSFAGKEVRSARLYTSGIQVPSSQIIAGDDKFTNVAGWNSTFYDFSNTAKVEFGLDEDKHVFHAAYFYAEIVFNIQFRDAVPATSAIATKTLQIDYRPGGGIYKDKDAILFNGYYKGQITSMTITAWDSPAKTTTVTVPSDLYLDLEFSTDRIYPFNLGTDALTSSNYNKRYLSSSNELEIYWDYFKGAEEYELEWTYVDDYLGSGGALTPSSTNLFYDFDHDATRIITTNTYYRIPLTYEQGYIIYRIRPIGRNNSNEREDGAWTIGPVNNINATSSLDYYQISSGFTSDNMNWSSTKTFAEYGKSGIGITYLDALSFNRQSIARLNTEGKSIVQSTLYDHFGRPAINFLPSPVTGLNLNFVTSLNMVPSGSASVLFDKRTFDLCSNNSCSSGVSSVLSTTASTGSANYYSADNPNLESQQAFIPDALGLPYSQIKYKKDPLGRIGEQTLPGTLHKLSSGKSIIFDYTKPAQVELDRLFGSEAGKALHYEKHITTDPNGQYSTSYLDMYGRVVATGLIGDSPTNVDQLTDITSTITLTDDLISFNQLSDHCWEVASSFFVTYSGEQQTFTYTTNIGVFVPSECTNPLCFDCEYNLTISITDECGQEVFYDDDNNPGTAAITYTNIIGVEGDYHNYCLPTLHEEAEGIAYNNAHSFTLTSASSATNIVISFPHPGVYNIYKTICASDRPVDEYLATFLNDATCNKKLCDYIDSLTNVTSFATCSLSCNSCSDLSGDYSTARTACIADSINNLPYYPPLSSGETAKTSDLCESTLCGKNNACNAYKQQLMADFMPGALYGATVSTDPNWAYSIYNESNTTLGGSWQNPPLQIKDANGDPAMVNYLGTAMSPSVLPTRNVFISNFQPSWAEAFLPLHQEYCKMKFYCDVLGSSLDYDEAMKKVDYYDDACSMGFIKPYTLISGSFSSYPPATGCSGSNLDPLFTVTSGTLYTILTSATLLTDWNSSMLDYVTGSPTENIYQTASEQAISDPLPSGHTFGNDICWADMEWIRFRELYLSRKLSLYTDLYSAYSSSTYCQANALGALITNHIPTSFDPATSLSGTELGFTTTSTGSGDSTTVANMLATNCAVACSSYVDLWVQNIKSCGYNSLSATDTVNLRRDLIAVCEKGCDVIHPWGSTNYPTGGTPVPYVIPSTSYTVYSFQDVLDVYFGTASCDANLITVPSPYTVNGMGGNATPFISDCGCNQLLQVEYDYNNSINVPSGITSARKLFNYRYNTELKDFNHLLCVCNSALSTPGSWTPGYSWSSGELTTLATDSVFVPTVLKCNTCVSCTQLESVVSAMGTQYGFTASNLTNVLTFINNNQQVALNNFNNAFNLLNGLQDYIKLLNDCRQFATTNTFSNNISPEASALQLYFDNLADEGILATDHNMSFCLDEKYYMSNLYDGPLPAIGNNYYDATVTSNTLVIDIKATSTSTPPLCSFTLTLPGSPPSWGNISSVTGITAYAPSPSAGPQYVFQVTVSDGTNSAVATGTTSCWNIATLTSSSPYEPQLCPKTNTSVPNKCQKDIMQGIIGQAKTLYNQYLATLKDRFKDAFLDTCTKSLKELFTRQYDLKEYHYTLYYYDQAGNLTRTVPPEGVDPLSINAPIGTGTPQYPLHSSATFGVNKYYNNLYQFNSYNEPMSENTVDGGQTYYYYDMLGRIVASQNSKQASNNAYSYTLYDDFGRIKEVGEVNNSSDSSGILSTYMGEDLSKFNSFITNGTRTQVIQTFYDETPGSTSFSNADARFTVSRVNLRNRVGSVTYEEVYDGVDDTYDFATHYTYDDHGNAIQIIQENVSLDHLYNQRFKRTDYEFELISGNVSQVTYQANQLDQYMHRYEYDADNRLKEVYTSTDGTIWNKDAKYIYYEHGPLARVETGDKKVQSLDYFYTIHGWIKGMNSNQLAMWTDPGKDGAATAAYNSLLTGLHQYVGKDVASYNLNYYNQGTDKDYIPVKAHNTSTDGNPMMSTTNVRGSSYFDLDADGRDLYNGNISSMVTGIVNMDMDIFKESTGLSQGLRTPFPQVAAYHYDQLHRITQMKTFRDFDATNNEWNTPTTSTYNDSYLNQFTYSANGNILTQYRNGASSLLKNGSALNMDDLSYTYLGYPALRTNKLICVSDNSGYTANYNDDIDDQSANCVFGVSTWNNTNYDYDATGNLISDSTECIKEIQWTVDRKVRSITRSKDQLTAQSKTLPDIEYLYDANRRRIAKIVKPRDAGSKLLLDQGDWTYTYYTYDASGNVMATYARTFTATASGWTDIYGLQEYDIYGSKRLGLIQHDGPALATRDFTANINHSRFVDISYDTPPSPEDIRFDTPQNWLGKKQYELTNHLGNVITVVSDRKIAAALTNTNCSAVYDFEDIAPPDSLAQFLDMSIGGGWLTCTFESGYWISGTNLPLGNNLSTSTVYQVDFDFDPGTVDVGDGLYIVMYDYCPSPWTFYLGPYVSYSLTGPAHYSFTYTPTAASPCFTTYIAFNSSSASTHYFRLDNVTMCPIGDIPIVQNYEPEILKTADYYPFGMEMPGRKYTALNYRYGFNGQEHDDEVFPGANTAEYWMYDARLGRRWNIDPLTYENQSPYIAFNNNPIYFDDPLGLEGEEGGDGGGDYTRKTGDKTSNPNGTLGGPSEGEACSNPDGSFEEYNDGEWTGQKGDYNESNPTPTGEVRSGIDINWDLFPNATYPIYQDLTPSIYENVKFRNSIYPNLWQQHYNAFSSEQKSAVREQNGCGKDNGCSSASGGKLWCEDWPPAMSFEALNPLWSMPMCVPRSEQIIQGVTLSAMIRVYNLERGDAYTIVLIPSGNNLRPEEVPQPILIPVPNPSGYHKQTPTNRITDPIPIHDGPSFDQKSRENLKDGAKKVVTTAILLEILAELWPILLFL